MTGLINLIFLISDRQTGIINDRTNSQNLQWYPLENIFTPSLVIDAKDVSTFPGSEYTAEHIPNAELVAFDTGGHLLVGLGEEARLP